MERGFMCPTDGTKPYGLVVSSRACEQLWAEPLAARIRAGSVYHEQPAETFGLLVTRSDLRTRRGTKHGRRQVRALIHAHWPLFAPSAPLLTDHDVASHIRSWHGMGHSAEHAVNAPLVSNWPDFAAAYRAELEDWHSHSRLAVARQIAAWLRRYETVTILSFEVRTPAHSTPDCWAQRHIFRDWLCEILPLAAPLGVRARPKALTCQQEGGGPQLDY